MIVYVVFCGDDYEKDIEKIFSKKEDAEKYIKESDHTFIQEHEVQS